MSKGYLALVLHAHLPYVRHPDNEHYLEERWLFEAITETYIPLIHVYENLIRDGIDFRVTMSVTPPLISMLTDPLLQERYTNHIEKLIELADHETWRLREEPHVQRLAYMYLEDFKKIRDTFNRYNRNLINAFRWIQDTGKLEIITCGATHGFFPLIGVQREAINAQIKVAVDLHTKHFGKPPKGIWLPECGYVPGDDSILKEYGIKYFFTDTHGILHAIPRPKYGVFAPVYTKSGVAAFGRDAESSKQVWSSNEGYPGDFYYREFYRDIGYDLGLDYIGPYIHKTGIRLHTGIKYHRITGPSNYKEYYIPEIAMEKAAEHAGNFMFNREKQVEFLDGIIDRKPIIVAPYDAELFGHWWYEGPQFIDFLFRKMHYDQNTVKLITPSEYLELYPANQVATPSASSWGFKGYNHVWLEKSNDWIYRHLHKACARMIELTEMFPNAQGDLRRALNQAARELLLAQSSDWAFIMKTGTMVDYAIRRTKEHIYRFNKLYDDIKYCKIDVGWLSNIEFQDNIFPDIDYRVYHRRVDSEQVVSA